VNGNESGVEVKVENISGSLNILSLTIRSADQRLKALESSRK
jgi:hypothetical protein